MNYKWYVLDCPVAAKLNSALNNSYHDGIAKTGEKYYVWLERRQIKKQTAIGGVFKMNFLERKISFSMLSPKIMSDKLNTPYCKTCKGCDII